MLWISAPCRNTDYKCKKGNCISKNNTCDENGLLGCEWEDGERESLCGKI